MKKIYTIKSWKKHKNLVSAFSTKALGNISFRTGDRKAVQANKEALVGELGIQWDNVLILPLSHSNRILSLSKVSVFMKDASNVYASGGHVFSSQTALVHNNPEWQSGIDAIVTDMRGLFPMIMSADCAAVGFFDNSKNVFALAHAGLIGAVNKIVIHTVQCMIEEYHSNPKDIEVVMFPSIRKCHYDLEASGAWKRIKADSLAHYGESDPVFLDGKFDLQGFLRRQLVASGIDIKNIHDVDLCTVCNHDMFFSNLAAGDVEAKKIEGRFASIMGVKDET